MIKYTDQDIEKLKDYCKEGTIIYEHLMDMGFSVKSLLNLLDHLPEEKKFVFEKPFRELPLEVSNPVIQGFLKWRLAIKK